MKLLQPSLTIQHAVEPEMLGGGRLKALMTGCAWPKGGTRIPVLEGEGQVVAVVE